MATCTDPTHLAAGVEHSLQPIAPPYSPLVPQWQEYLLTTVHTEKVHESQLCGQVTMEHGIPGSYERGVFPDTDAPQLRLAGVGQIVDPLLPSPPTDAYLQPRQML